MKAIFKFAALALLATAFTVSCQREQDFGPTERPTGTRTFTLSFAPNTKVAIGEGENLGKTTWEEGDEIMINGGVNGTEQELVKLTADDILDGGKKALISVSLEPYVPMSDGQPRTDILSTYYAQYPASAVAEGPLYYNQAFFDTNAPLMAACNVDYDFVFYNLCGVIAFEVDEDFDYYVFAGNNKETVGYEYYQARVRNETDGIKVEYLKAADTYPAEKLVPLAEIGGEMDEEGGVNYVFLPAGADFSAGFNFEFYKDDVLVSVASTDSSVKVEPGQILDLGDITEKLEDYVAPEPSDHQPADWAAGAYDLSIGGQAPANCYIVRAPGVYMFPALAGNTEKPVGNVYGAELLWETYNNAEEVELNSVIADVDFDNDNIYFKTPDALKAGNALIAATNSAGKIIWSWHIWIPQDDIATNTYNLFPQELMDRNLGALVAAKVGEPAPIESFGLTYQWGRKDPFVGPKNNPGGDADNATVAGQEVQDGDGPLTLMESINKPTTVGYVKDADWLTSPDNTLWTDAEKTAADPCPAGYRVPARDKEQPLFKDITAQTGWNPDLANSIITVGDPLAVFPIAGYRDDYGPESFAKVGVRVCYWTSYASGTTKAYNLDWRPGDVDSSTGAPKPSYSLGEKPKARGGYIRCVKIDGWEEPEPPLPPAPEDPMIPESEEAVALPYAETFAADFGKFGVYDEKGVEGKTIWFIDTSNKYAKASAYINSTNNEAVSWLYSPYIDLTNATKPILSFTHCGNKMNTTDVHLYARFKDGEWNEFQFPEPVAGNAWTWFDNELDMSIGKGKIVQIAFKYTSTSEKAGTYELKNLKVGEFVPSFSVDKKAFEVVADATEVTVNITSNIAWTVTPGEGVEADKTAGTGKAAVKLTFAANTAETPKTYSATIAAEGFDPIVISIAQAAALPEGISVDVLNCAFTGLTGTSYTAWADKEGTSGAKYSGISAAGNSSIQLNEGATNKAGVVTTVSGGLVRKVKVTWNTNTSATRYLDVYGSNEAYTAPADLHDIYKRGTLLGTVAYTGADAAVKELEVAGDYAYVGFRTRKSAQYLDNVVITWEAATPAEVPAPSYTWDFSTDAWQTLFAKQGTVGSDLTGWDIVNDGLQIVSTVDKSKYQLDCFQMGGKANIVTDQVVDRYFAFTAPKDGYVLVKVSNTGESAEESRKVALANNGEITEQVGGVSCLTPTNLIYQVKAGRVLIYPNGNGLRFYKILFSETDPTPVPQPAYEHVWGWYSSGDGSTLWGTNLTVINTYAAGYGMARGLAMDDEYIYLPKMSGYPAIAAVKITDPNTQIKGSVEGVSGGNIDGDNYFSCFVRMMKNTDPAVNGGKDVLLLGNVTDTPNGQVEDPNKIVTIYAYTNGIEAAPVVLAKYAYDTANTVYDWRRYGDRFFVTGTWQNGKIWLPSFNPMKVVALAVANGERTGVIQMAATAEVSPKGIKDIVVWEGVDTQYLLVNNEFANLVVPTGNKTAQNWDELTLNFAVPTAVGTWGYNLFQFNDKNYIAYARLDGKKACIEIIEANVNLGRSISVPQVFMQIPINSAASLDSELNSGGLADCAVRVIDGVPYIAALTRDGAMTVYKLVMK